MANYKPEVLRKYAGRMLARALGIEIEWGLAGLLAGMLALKLLDQRFNGKEPMLTLAAFFVCLILGIAIGIEKAFMLKVQAQTVLCQVQIEENTRAAKA